MSKYDDPLKYEELLRLVERNGIVAAIVKQRQQFINDQFRRVGDILRDLGITAGFKVEPLFTNPCGEVDLTAAEPVSIYANHPIYPAAAPTQAMFCGHCGKKTHECSCFDLSDLEETPKLDEKVITKTNPNWDPDGGVISSAPPPRPADEYKLEAAPSVDRLEDPGPLLKGTACYMCAATNKHLARLRDGKILVCGDCFVQHFAG